MRPAKVVKFTPNVPPVSKFGFVIGKSLHTFSVLHKPDGTIECEVKKEELVKAMLEDLQNLKEV